MLVYYKFIITLLSLMFLHCISCPCSVTATIIFVTILVSCVFSSLLRSSKVSVNTTIATSPIADDAESHDAVIVLATISLNEKRLKPTGFTAAKFDDTIYSCFFPATVGDRNKSDHKILLFERDICCKGLTNVIEILQDIVGGNDGDGENENFHRNSFKTGPHNERSVMYQRCLLELAQVPLSIEGALSSSSLSQIIEAKFSWAVTTLFDDEHFKAFKKKTLSCQYITLYNSGSLNDDFGRVQGISKANMRRTQTVSPFHIDRDFFELLKADEGAGSEQLLPTTATTVDHHTKGSYKNVTIKILSKYLDGAMSNLYHSGGMHRLFQHSIRLTSSMVSKKVSDKQNVMISLDNISFYLYVIIPQGMFIDLDDPFEAIQSPSFQRISTSKIEQTIATMTTAMNDTDYSSASSSTFSVVLQQPNVESLTSLSSFRARLYYASVSDIEQPAFVSGQYVLIWEIDEITFFPDVLPKMFEHPILGIEFATKLHLRYPNPSPSMETYIHLPKPIILFVEPHLSHELKESTSSGSYNMDLQHDYREWQQLHQRQLDLESSHQIWVASGNKNDHDFVMKMTLCFCLIGVGMIMRDISKVSKWDDL